METIANIFLKSDTSFEINEISQVPIVFNHDVYQYYLSLLSFSFLNCSPNIYENNYLKYTITYTAPHDPETQTQTQTITPGLYNTEDIIGLLNTYFIFDYTDPDTQTTTQKQVLEFSINPFTELTEVVYHSDNATLLGISSIVIDNSINGSILSNDLFRISNSTLTFTSFNSSFTSDNAFRISTYNNVYLSSSSIPGLVSLYGNDNGITTSSALYVISSVADPYSMIEYTAIQPIDFPIDHIPNLSNYQFKLYDENNNDLKLLPNSTPDFSVKLAIKRMKRNTTIKASSGYMY
jgi:hypothetical protein